MASYENAESVSLLAGSDFTGDLYKVVEVSAANTVDLASAATDVIVGVVGEEVTVGKVCPIVLLKGRVKMLVGVGDVTVGELIIPIIGGTVTSVTGFGALIADQMGLGVALESGVDGDVVEVFAMPVAAPHSA